MLNFLQPLLFLKPWTAVTEMEGEITIPSDKGQVHHELEIAYVVGETLVNATEEQVRKAIKGIGLALDLTLRDEQQALKTQGFPWDKSKGFDHSCPISCVPIENVDAAIDAAAITLIKNGTVQQQTHCSEMIFATIPLISHMSKWFTLNEGDIILTGTPAGVSALSNGDQLLSTLTVNEQDILSVETVVKVAS